MNDQDIELEEQKEEHIQILSASVDGPARDEIATIDTSSPCNTITIQKLTDLMGTDVQYTQAGNDNPHRHHGLLGTIGLFVETEEIMVGSRLVFCILAHESRPIVLNESMKPIDNTGPQVLTFGIPVPDKDGMRP